MENTNEFPITLGLAQIRSIPGQLNKKDYTVPLQNYYLLDKHYIDLIDSGSAVPDYLRQKVLTTPSRPHKPR